MSHRYRANQYPYSGTWTRTWEPGPVLGNLDPYLGTWNHTREPVLVYVLKSWLNIDGKYGKWASIVQFLPTSVLYSVHYTFALYSIDMVILD